MKMLLASVACLFAFGTAPAAAQAEPIDRSINPALATTVDLREFDFETVEGIAGAHRRIVSTSYQLCSPLLRGVKSERRDYRQCIMESVENAIWRANHADLASFHLALTPAERSYIWKDVPAGWQPRGQ